MTKSFHTQGCAYGYANKVAVHNPLAPLASIHEVLSHSVGVLHAVQATSSLVCAEKFD